mmetsp:Transcript_45440/g.74174  ORF Transcript_45440/g.74174 Transcript_45440/m.74174 type:complete len:80 (+) Transcript_45440:326-565(+)
MAPSRTHIIEPIAAVHSAFTTFGGQLADHRWLMDISFRSGAAQQFIFSAAPVFRTMAFAAWSSCICMWVQLLWTKQYSE